MEARERERERFHAAAGIGSGESKGWPSSLSLIMEIWVNTRDQS